MEVDAEFIAQAASNLKDVFDVGSDIAQAAKASGLSWRRPWAARKRPAPSDDIRLLAEWGDNLGAWRGGLVTDRAESFTKHLEFTFNDLNQVPTMEAMSPPFHPRFDILQAAPDQLTSALYLASPNEFRGLRGIPNWDHSGMSKGMGEGAVYAQTNSVFTMIGKEGIPSLAARYGTLRYKVEETVRSMKDEGLRPSIVAIPGSVCNAVREQFGMTDSYIPVDVSGSCFLSFRDRPFNLSFVQGDPQISDDNAYVVDLEKFCKIRFYRDRLLEWSWYKRPSYNEDTIGFLVKMNYEVTLKEPSAARRILIKGE